MCRVESFLQMLARVKEAGDVGEKIVFIVGGKTCARYFQYFESDARYGVIVKTLELEISELKSEGIFVVFAVSVSWLWVLVEVSGWDGMG